MEIMIGPKPRPWKKFSTRRELLTALGSRFRDEFPTTRFNFTQPIIDSVTEDTNGTSANLAVELSGPDSDVLLRLARKTVDLLKSIPGSQDVAIEQEGPQPQLVIMPNRQLCARYNVRIEDVTTLINTALGGQPVGTLYEGEQRFPIVVKIDRTVIPSPQAVERLPVHNADGLPIPLGQVAKIDLIDGQTIIARENSRRRLTVRTDIVGRDQGSFVWDAQRKFEKEIQPSVPAGFRVAWLGMFENLQRAQMHFLVVMPITVGLIFGLLLLTFFSLRAAVLLLASVPFAFIGGVLALYVRGMNLNVSTGVGFAALFGVSIMNGVLMVRSITAARLKHPNLVEAIIQGAQDCLRPILLASLVAILGLLPASLATGLGSDVQRPLATVIVWGLFSSTVLTLLVVPVAYGIFPPSLRSAAPAAIEPSGMEPPPDVAAAEVIGLLKYLREHGGEAKVMDIATGTHREFSRIVNTVKAGEMLGLVETPLTLAVLTEKGRRLIEAPLAEQKMLWREQLLTLALFREAHDVLRRQEVRAVDLDFILEMIVMRMPYENHSRVFNTFVDWARFGDLFAYDDAAQSLKLLR
jgi:cobalt-zinc-cadmium resistance protein CzcA